MVCYGIFWSRQLSPFKKKKVIFVYSYCAW